MLKCTDTSALTSVGVVAETGDDLRAHSTAEGVVFTSLKVPEPMS